MHHSALQASRSNPKLARHQQHHRCSTRSSSSSSMMYPATTLRLCRDTSVREIVCLPFFSRQLPMRSETSSSCAAFASRIFLRDLHMDMQAHVAASSGTHALPVVDTPGTWRGHSLLSKDGEVAVLLLEALHGHDAHGWLLVDTSRQLHFEESHHLQNEAIVISLQMTEMTHHRGLTDLSRGLLTQEIFSLRKLSKTCVVECS